MYDLLIMGGNIVDPASDLLEQAEVAIQGGRVVAVAKGLHRGSARQVVDAGGQWVLPGLIDSHVHVSARPEGYRMMAQAGVTCALDMAGQPEEMIAGLLRAGAGLTVGFLYPLVPGETLTNQHPSRNQKK